MTLLRRLLVQLLTLLRPSRSQQAVQRTAFYRPITSFQRRYPGRTPASELRRNLGWIADQANRPHRDRRA